MISSKNGESAAAALKTYFKTPEGRYKLHCDKTHPASLLPFSQSKTITQVTLAQLKDKVSAPATPTSSSSGVSSGVRSAAARFLGTGNGSRSLSFVGGNGSSKSLSGASRTGSLGASSSYNFPSYANFDAKGTYLIFNVGDTVFISDLNSQDKDPIKCIQFSNSYPVCHAFDEDAKDGHDLLIGLANGEVYSVSLRQQLQEVGKKLVGAHQYNKDGSVDNSRCNSIAWVPSGGGTFIVAHVNGNLYVYEKNKDGSGEPSFPIIKDQAQFSVVHARNSKNPIARWHICQGSVNSIAFSSDGTYIATVGRDVQLLKPSTNMGYLRIFKYKNEQLIWGGKSYYGALLRCSWSMDGKYILTGGEDDLVHVWSMDDRKTIAWGEGHNSWVSGVAFDSYWSTPNADETGEEGVVYRIGSVGQDTQLLLWDLELDEIVVPVRRPPSGSPAFSTGSQSSHWDSACPVGTLKPSPRMRDVPKLSPLVAHRAHTEPLYGLIFTPDSILTGCREGQIKIYTRPGSAESQSVASDNFLSTSLKDKQLPTVIPGSSYRH